VTEQESRPRDPTDPLITVRDRILALPPVDLATDEQALRPTLVALARAPLLGLETETYSFCVVSTAARLA
jgi:hypothetical protein